MGFVIAVSQAKGGSSKTTTCVNLAGALKEQGYKVVVADMDKDKPDAIRWSQQGDNHIDFIEELFDDKPMDRIEHLRKQYDFIILDTPPNYMPAAFKAIMLSDFVILPCSPSFLDQNNLTDAIAVPRMSQKPFRILGVKVKKRQRLSEQLVEELNKSGLAFKTMISSRTAILECAFEGKWIGDFDKNSNSHMEFLRLAEELRAFFSAQKSADPQKVNSNTPTRTADERI
ncbi:ParA family protein [Legionella spiritensis]|uniref:Sporulation initiation inhibitor protein Soj n=1 Tax=Legionella spiritensis TaxID=452 RepID=A0A0W0YZA4_LEGSP|nr:ParA family protein [Legionella spiritensis]KTD62234.1 Sporulation initiation inhibitor protein Soj [Legionella spiritensis]SNV29059.1 Sporulation initiation inhibitor protein soj [Legionella spiritensis]